MSAQLPRGTDPETLDLHNALALFCAEFDRGKPPGDQRDLFCGARPIALAEGPAGVRPIAVGETLRRLAAKCLVEKYQAAVDERLTPLQLWMGIRGATEAMIHKVKDGCTAEFRRLRFVARGLQRRIQ